MSWIPGDIQLYPHLSLYIPHIWKMHGNHKQNERCSPTGLSFARWIAESEGKKSRTPDWLVKTRVSCRFSLQSPLDWSWMDCSAVWCSLRLMRSSNKANLGRRRNELDDGFDQPQRCPKIDKKLGEIGSSNNPVSTVFLSFEGKPFCCKDQRHSFNKPYAPRNHQLKLVIQPPLKLVTSDSGDSPPLLRSAEKLVFFALQLSLQSGKLGSCLLHLLNLRSCLQGAKHAKQNQAPNLLDLEPHPLISIDHFKATHALARPCRIRIVSCEADSRGWTFSGPWSPALCFFMVIITGYGKYGSENGRTMANPEISG